MTPRENGWEELVRPAVERAWRRIKPDDDPVMDDDAELAIYTTAAALRALHDRLAAARGEPGLDVEQQERFKWNANERADRAEAIAGKLAGALSRVAYVTFGPDRGFDQPEGSRSPDGLTWVSAPRLRALLDEYNRLAAARGEPGLDVERTWPSRDEFRRMSPAEVNRYFASLGLSVRVVE